MDNLKFLNFGVFKTELMVFLTNFQHTNLFEISINLIFLVLFVFYTWIYSYSLFTAYHVFVETNKEYLTSICKTFQEILNNNQTTLFFLVNIIVFFVVSFLFDPFLCLIIHILWLDVYAFFYLMYVINFPVISFILIGSLFIRLFLSGLFNATILFVALFCYFIFSCMDELGLFNPIKSYIEIIQADQLKLLNHKKTEFLFFYVLEQQYLVMLILIFLVPRLFEEAGFFVILELNEEDFLLHVKFYMYAFIIAVAVINLVVVLFFKPGPLFKTVAACLGCVGGVATVGAAYVSYTGLCVGHGDRGY